MQLGRGASLAMNLVQNALRPGYGREMLRKLWIRWRERDQGSRRAQSVEWCRERQVDAAAWARSIARELWSEAEAFAHEQQALAARKSVELGMPVGGAGFHALLYFLTRYVRPATVVETGVAFGFSSRAFLRALSDNGGGRLFSSDFPYFRQSEPERLIGVLVEPGLRDHWTLLVAGDRANLPIIAGAADRIDLLHYDSDKSYSGRDFALHTLRPSLAKDALVIFDDIQDNLHFRDWTQVTGADHWIFEYGGKWIGMTGGPRELYAVPSTSPRFGRADQVPSTSSR
jgi:predicted O-methyltransferase YrrM